ncbi:hypothetical protein ACTRV7_04920 [Staphylococcus xylosus]|uniref:hypothetical protein n=1 Tax=Staphylococcus xylosus TaxID=1288 RepID=UPI003F96CBE6
MGVIMGKIVEVKEKPTQLILQALDEEDLEKQVNAINEMERKARAYDLLKEDLLINEKVFREQAENDEVSDIIHGHYVALLVQAELERTNDGR